MKPSLEVHPRHRLIAFLLLAMTAAPTALVAQQTAIPATPTTPTQFDTKRIGAATPSTGATVIPPPTPSPTVRQITYLTLSPLRSWTSPEGKTLHGKLIAWEETITTGPTPQALPDKPLTTRPTVLKNNKARLLIDNKAYEVPLARLDPESQKFIQALQAHLAPKP